MSERYIFLSEIYILASEMSKPKESLVQRELDAQVGVSRLTRTGGLLHSGKGENLPSVPGESKGFDGRLKRTEGLEAFIL